MITGWPARAAPSKAAPVTVVPVKSSASGVEGEALVAASGETGAGLAVAVADEDGAAEGDTAAVAGAGSAVSTEAAVPPAHAVSRRANTASGPARSQRRPALIDRNGDEGLIRA
jgi:hypothetical protein